MPSTFQIPRPHVRPVEKKYAQAATPKRDRRHIYEPDFDPPPLAPPSLPVPKTGMSVFGTDKVSNLQHFSFGPFITGKEKALVIFYNGTSCLRPSIAKAFASVAANSRNRNHVFGSVDCTSDPALCIREIISKMPILKLYSNGFLVSVNEFAEMFNADQLQMWISMTPVSHQPMKKK